MGQRASNQKRRPHSPTATARYSVYHTCVTHWAYFSSSFWSVRTLSDSSRSIRVSSSIRPCWAVSWRSMRCTFCSRSCTRPHTLSIETVEVDGGETGSVDDGFPVPPTMWIVLAFRFWGVGERLVFRRCTLSGRLLFAGDGGRLVVASCVPLLLLVSTTVVVAEAAVVDEDDVDEDEEEMAILVEVVVLLLDSADIDLVIALTLEVVEDVETVCCCRSLTSVEEASVGSFLRMPEDVL